MLIKLSTKFLKDGQPIETNVNLIPPPKKNNNNRAVLRLRVIPTRLPITGVSKLGYMYPQGYISTFQGVHYNYSNYQVHFRILHHLFCPITPRKKKLLIDCYENCNYKG